MTGENDQEFAYHRGALMPDPSLFLKLGQSFYLAVRKPVTKQVLRVKVWIFGLRNRKSPLAETKAKQIATSILGGDVRIAISFRSMDTEHVRIAALQRASERNIDSKVF